MNRSAEASRGLGGDLASGSVGRRGFTGATLGSLLTFSLLEALASHSAFAAEIKPIAARWLKDLHELGLDLKGRKITAVEWQAKTEELFGKVELARMLELIDFPQLEKAMKFRERGETSMHPTLPRVEGLPTSLVFGHQVFGMRQGRSVVPHGHNNMATAFLILKGEFRGRLYNRLEDLGQTHMILRPTQDETFKPGGASTISDDKDNVHWFQALSETGFIFNIHVLNVNPDVQAGGRVYVDPLGGEKLSDGKIKAARLKATDAYKLYG